MSDSAAYEIADAIMIAGLYIMSGICLYAATVPAFFGMLALWILMIGASKEAAKRRASTVGEQR